MFKTKMYQSFGTHLAYTYINQSILNKARFRKYWLSQMS